MGGPLGGKRPEWLRPGRDISHTSESNRRHYERSVKYYQQRWAATPPWLSDEHRKQIRDIYRECKRQRGSGRNVVVDHIVPLISPIVCGLEVPWNLQILSEKSNAVKSNTWWPGNPFETKPLFEENHQPHQLRLPL